MSRALFPIITELWPRDGVTIENHHVVAYDTDVRLTMQQTKSRLEDCCTPYPNIVGRSKRVSRITGAEAEQIVSRHSDTKLSEDSHVVRFIDLTDWAKATLLDEEDEMKVLANPRNAYVTGAVASLNRRKDKEIIAALGGSARTADNTYVALPVAQTIVHGSANITLAKIRSGIQILNENEADSPDEMGAQRTFVYTADQLTILMAEASLTSADYNALQALQNYTIKHFLGLEWRRVEFLPKVLTTRTCYIFGKSYVGFGTGNNLSNSIDKRPDKNNATQFLSKMSLGAVRIEDAGVVGIECTEAA